MTANGNHAKRPSLRNEEYTIGWIAALYIEAAAAYSMFDEIHDEPQQRNPTDENSYTLGRIGQHNVVLAFLPDAVYGTISAAIVAAQMRSSFPSLKMGLLVGIGGGIPSKGHDIRLGDVVVSQPDQNSPGVVQFDRGKTGKGGLFERTGSLNKPPIILQNAISYLQNRHNTHGSQITTYLSEMGVKYPKMKNAYGYQGQSNDLLFKADYDHVDDDDETCKHCNPRKLVHRGPRSTVPVIHYGTIASSNRVIKDGITRDRLGKELGAICFEMEAAGVMDIFPTAVIRGICDYSDSHKNDRWQRYAAATAAAYAKELLGVIPARDVYSPPREAQMLSSEISALRQDIDMIKRIYQLGAPPLPTGTASPSPSSRPTDPGSTKVPEESGVRDPMSHQGEKTSTGLSMGGMMTAEFSPSAASSPARGQGKKPSKFRFWKR